MAFALVASGAMVWHASYSAFSSTTSNPTNKWAAGTVAQADDDSNTAMFNASSLKPGSTGSKCIAVTSTGSLPSAVKLYGTSYATTNALAANNVGYVYYKLDKFDEALAWYEKTMRLDPRRKEVPILASLRTGIDRSGSGLTVF